MPTADASRIATLLPMAGAKGSSLSFLIECLCSLTVHNPIVAGAIEAGGAGDDRFLNGTLPLHLELERELAEWMGTEGALVFTTGYQANGSASYPPPKSRLWCS